MKIQRITYLSLGSNMGDKLAHLQNAINSIATNLGIILKISPIYQTDAWGFEGEAFYNCCIKLSTYHAPDVLMDKILAIEKKLGRVRSNSENYENRSIDIDILLFDDEIIFSPDVIIPHPKMLERKFVLQPLADIASSFLHPIQKQQIQQCLQNCDDKNEIKIIQEKLVRPIPLSEKYNYIAIEGNIGAGKTSLTKLLSDEFNAKIVLERFADNPFLPKFYEDKERFAFPLEMSFLADRYQQLSEDLAQLDLFKSFVVSDYYIFKSLIFAQITLHKDELYLYRKMFDIMYKEITKPDLYIYLYQNTKRLLKNIQKRGRSYEQSIDEAYLQKIQDGYKTFINSQNEEMKILLIDVTELDFVSNREDFEFVLQQILAT
ncbi:MAG: 2-amino-4-hydroxy-6-hydroxymethyldihydropteridine diphosphokinase [Polaribacter sp.]|nr:2-amino-4-hydroxy-6-hydroxymethyldihydropteridine diphosphokinase [Polaribacter sp.]